MQKTRGEMTKRLWLRYREGEVDIRVEYQREKEKYSDLADIISRNRVTFLRGTEVLQGKLKICIQERRKSQEGTETSECKENKNKSRRRREERAGSTFYKPQCRLK